MMLKRVVAVAGDKVAFRRGVLHVNGKAVHEPYVIYPCDWNLPTRMVRPGHVYMVGDNRDVPMSEHSFGQATTDRIMGAPLW
jgi:signal peptidase I